MKIHKSAFYSLFCSLLLVFALGAFTAAAAEPIASIKVVTGVVELLRSGKLPAMKASVGDSLSAGDLVRTKSGGYAEVQYRDGSLLKIAQRSRVDIGEQGKGNEPTNAKLVRGKVQAIVEPATGQAAKGKRFEIRTPNAVAGVRGTDWITTFHRNVTGVFVNRGTVYTYNRLLPDRIVNVTQSTLTTITAGAPPTKPRPATRNEVERMQQDMAPQPEKKSGDSSAGSPVATATSQSQQPRSSEVIPTDVPITVSSGVSALLGGTTPKVQPMTPVYNPVSVQQPAVITAPPPPPPPVLPTTATQTTTTNTTTPTTTTTTTTTPSTRTNVNVDVKF
jgi:FecR-like protein